MIQTCLEFQYQTSCKKHYCLEWLRLESFDIVIYVYMSHREYAVTLVNEWIA